MINLDKVSKKFGTGVFGISDISFSVDKGEFLFLIGPTGSGKTTIFRILIREILPTKGSVIVNNWDIVKLPQSKVPELRKKIGVIFQDLKLLLDRTILENVSLPLEVSGIKPEQAFKRAEEALSQVDILEHKDKFPVQLSGGELQRVAIARALILSPDIILADEPTGNLDEKTSWEIVKLLSDINEKGTTIVMATHNADIIKKLGKRVIELDKGNVINDKGGVKKEVKPEPEQKEENIKELKTEPLEEDSGVKEDVLEKEKTEKKDEVS